LYSKLSPSIEAIGKKHHQNPNKENPDNDVKDEVFSFLLNEGPDIFQKSE